MSNTPDRQGLDHSELAVLYAVGVLPLHELATAEAHIATCATCQQEVEALRPIVASFVDWPTDVLRPSAPLWSRLTQRIGVEIGKEPHTQTPSGWREPEWKEVAQGISCKLLAMDTQRQRVSMLVRLAPGTDYPPHTHGGVEELHLLDGELWIEDRKLYPGDYNRAEPGTADKRVWSETGCMCVLITSTQDAIG
jgi:anti-sigma factor ChrR (cupin superfamily)